MLEKSRAKKISDVLNEEENEKRNEKNVYVNQLTNFTKLIDNLNRGEWRELEEEVRDLAKSLGPIKVRIELNFSSESQVLPTGATIPDGFYKFLTFNDGSKKCYYFENQPTDRNWTEYEINCN